MLRTTIDWDENRMSIPEPKVEHHEGRGVRSCPNFDLSSTKRSRYSATRANMWSRLRSIELPLIRRWVGSVVLVLNEMLLVLVLVIDAVGPSRSTSTKIPVNMRNRTAARVPITRGLLLAWQLATHRTAELPARDRR